MSTSCQGGDLGFPPLGARMRQAQRCRPGPRQRRAGGGEPGQVAENEAASWAQEAGPRLERVSSSPPPPQPPLAAARRPREATAGPWAPFAFAVLVRTLFIGKAGFYLPSRRESAPVPSKHGIKQ